MSRAILFLRFPIVCTGHAGRHIDLGPGLLPGCATVV